MSSCFNSCCAVTLATGIVGGIAGSALYNLFCCGLPCNEGGAFADYYQVITGVGNTFTAGQPLIISQLNINSCGSGISAGLMQVNSGATGTVFTLTYCGIYDIEFNGYYATNGSLSVYSGTVASSMTEIQRSIVGHTDGTMQMNGKVRLQTTVSPTLISVNASAGNANTITFPVLSSTTNINATTIFISQIQ